MSPAAVIDWACAGWSMLQDSTTTASVVASRWTTDIAPSVLTPATPRREHRPSVRIANLISLVHAVGVRLDPQHGRARVLARAAARTLVAVSPVSSCSSGRWLLDSSTLPPCRGPAWAP